MAHLPSGVVFVADIINAAIYGRESLWNGRKNMSSSGVIQNLISQNCFKVRLEVKVCLARLRLVLCPYEIDGSL